MAKASGGTKLVRPYSFDRQLNINEFHREMGSGNYVPEYSHVSTKTGAYVLFQKGHNYHEEEIEAAKILADNGYNVKLTPEGEQYKMYATKIRKDGIAKFSEGTINILTYEQKTPTKNTLAIQAVNKAINHAIDKSSNIALIYDKYGTLHRQDISEGMKYAQSKSDKWKRNGLIVMVVNNKGGVFEHHFDA